MKEKLHKDVFRIGSKSVDHNNLTAFEAVTMSVVAVLAITIGTMYGDKLF